MTPTGTTVNAEAVSYGQGLLTERFTQPGCICTQQEIARDQTHETRQEHERPVGY